MSLQDYVDEREKILMEMAGKISDYETKINDDHTLKDAYKPQKIAEYKAEIEESYRTRLEANERSFTQAMEKAASNVEVASNPDLPNDLPSYTSPDEKMARQLRESNLLRKLDYLDADDFRAYLLNLQDEMRIMLEAIE